MKTRAKLPPYLLTTIAGIASCSQAGSTGPVPRSATDRARPSAPLVREGRGAKLLDSHTQVGGVSLDKEHVYWIRTLGVRGEGPSVTRTMGVLEANRRDWQTRLVGQNDELLSIVVLDDALYVTGEDCVIWRFPRANGAPEKAYGIGSACRPLVADGPALLFGGTGRHAGLWSLVPHPGDWYRDLRPPQTDLGGVVESIAVDGDSIYYATDDLSRGRVQRLIKALWRNRERLPTTIYEGSRYLRVASNPTHLFVSDRERNAVFVVEKTTWTTSLDFHGGQLS